MLIRALNLTQRIIIVPQPTTLLTICQCKVLVHFDHWHHSIYVMGCFDPRFYRIPKYLSVHYG